MKWLYSFEINGETTIFGDKLDKGVLLSMIKPSEDDLNIVLGRWDFDIDDAIKKVEKELKEGKLDIIDQMIESDQLEKMQYCSVCEVLQEVSGNRKYCKNCKTLLTKLNTNEDDIVDDTGKEEEEDLATVYKLRIFDNDDMCKPTFVQLKEVKDKRINFPHVRNIEQKNDAIYETEKCVYVNPNKFERIEKVFEEI